MPLGMMREHSERTTCCGWADGIDIDIDAMARRRADDNVARHCGEILDVAMAQVHTHCDGWWTYREITGEGVRQRFCPMVEWTTLPAPLWTTHKTARSDPIIDPDRDD